MRSAVIAAVGALIKFTPALILGAVWRFREVRSALRYSLITVGIFAMVYAAAVRAECGDDAAFADGAVQQSLV